MWFDFVIVGGGLVGVMLVLCLFENFKVLVCLIEVGGCGDGLMVCVLIGVVVVVNGWVGINNWVFKMVL